MLGYYLGLFDAEEILRISKRSPIHSTRLQDDRRHAILLRRRKNHLDLAKLRVPAIAGWRPQAEHTAGLRLLRSLGKWCGSARALKLPVRYGLGRIHCAGLDVVTTVNGSESESKVRLQLGHASMSSLGIRLASE